MILVEAGERSEKGLDAKLLFAAQLAARGHRVVLDDVTLPDQMDRHQQYAAMPFVADLNDVPLSRVVIVGAEDISHEILLRIRSLDLPPETGIAAAGRFADHQARVSSQSKIAYAAGREPVMVDLLTLQGAPLVANALSPLAAGAVRARRDEGVPRLFLAMPQDMLDDPQTLPILSAMNNLPDYRLSLILPGRGKEQVRESRYAALDAHGYSELLPATFAALADIAVFLGEAVPGERMAAVALDLMRRGGVAVDCTAVAGLLAAGAPAVRGPQDIAALANYLKYTVLPNRGEIARQALQTDWLAKRSIETLEAALSLAVPDRPKRDEAQPLRTVFVPTNGIGLGHARRCTLLAGAMDAAAHRVFAAFPSCVELVRDHGFDCLPLVQKSAAHPDEHANDLLTYLRLRRLLHTGDRLVFDGGYVFDSIYRVIHELGLEATWIRRGLFQPGQSLALSLDRESAFRRVIVPEEAFPELNAGYSHGLNIHSVGPIVQQAAVLDSAERQRRRVELGERLRHPFERLVVTMLGGGAAADRTAQLQALATMFEGRPDCLHLVVVWPGAVVASGLNGWKRTRVVQTRQALSLCQIADFAISAAGYNSFHELLYHRIPAIFVPQMAGFMDDQERRARAASDRDLAVTALSHELLLLEREVEAFLDAGRAEILRSNLSGVSLPSAGTRDAAALIEGRAGP